MGKSHVSVAKRLTQFFYNEIWNKSLLSAIIKLSSASTASIETVRYDCRIGERAFRMDSSQHKKENPGVDDLGLKAEEKSMERMQPEAALARERDLLQSVLNSAGKAHLVYLDRDFNFVRVNETYAATCGYRPEEMIGKNHFALYPHAENEAIFRRVRDTGEPFEVRDKPFEFPDYPERGITYWDWTLIPVKDAGGQVTGLIFSLFETTPRKRAEEALREANERYELVLAGAEAGIWDWDVPGHCIVYSTRWKEMRGFAEGEITNAEAEWSSRIHPDDAPRVMAAVEAHFQGRTPVFDEEYRVQHKDGSWIWIADRGIARRDANGQVLRMAGSEADITARKQAEASLRESEERFRELVERSPFGIYVVDSQFRIANMNASSQTGAFRNVRSVIGRPFDEAMRILWPEPVAAEIIGHFRHTLDTGEPYYSKDFINPRADVDQTEGYEWELHRITLPDGQQGVICYYFDSTKLREAEAAVAAAHRQTQSIINNTTLIVYAFDLEERFVIANTAVAELFDSTPEQMLGKRRDEFMPKEDADWHEANDRQVIEAGRALEFEECSQLPGRSITWLTTKFPLRDAQGKIYAVAGISADITARKQAEEELRNLTEKLMRSNSDLKQFAYIASHDLQSPLRNIEGFVRLLAKRYKNKLDDRADEYITHISGGVKDMQDLIHDLLQISTLDSGDKSITSVDMTLCVNKAISSLKAAIEEKNAEITYDERLPVVHGVSLS